MLIEIGAVEAIFRYPVKSMGGERLGVTNLGWYGLEGDRRLAFRRMGNRSGMPWLTASKLPDLLRFVPQRREDGAHGRLTFLRIFARRMAKRCLSSGRTWPRRLDAGTGLPSR